MRALILIRNQIPLVIVYAAGRPAGGVVFLESLILDIRYALRGIRRSPFFAGSVAATIGLGLGILCSGFTILNGFQTLSLPELLGVQKWAFDAFSVAASLLGVIGLVLAFSGTYAVVAFLLAQRTREFGIRMAIGATVRQSVAGMMGETMRAASIGLGAGLVVAFALARAFGGVIPLVPVFALRPYLVGVLVVLAATMTAALLPSLRVSRIDPSGALRGE